MDLYIDLSSAGQTAYAQLLEATQTASVMQSVKDLHGSFAKKTVKNAVYWYFQFRDVDKRLKQIYVGPDNARVQALISRAKEGAGAISSIEGLARSAEALGCVPVATQHFRIIRRLSEYGFFKAGGVLIGTHAFIAMGNMLGIRWTDGAMTQDVDFADAGKNLSIALPADIKVDMHDAISSLEMGFLPIQSFAGEAGASYVNPKEPELKIDFLTSLTRKNEPYQFPNLNIALQPLKFMEFSLEDTTQGVIFSREGSVVVNLPSPIRYGLHKLLVFGEREGKFRTKSLKDAKQSAAILTYYARHMPEELKKTLKDLLGRGPGWKKRAQQGIEAVLKISPDLAQYLGTPKGG